MTYLEKLAMLMSWDEIMRELREKSGRMGYLCTLEYIGNNNEGTQRMMEAIADVENIVDVIKTIFRLDENEMMDMKYHKIRKDIYEKRFKVSHDSSSAIINDIDSRSDVRDNGIDADDNRIEICEWK